MINDKALLCLPCVKDEQIKLAEQQVMKLRMVAAEYSKIEEEALAKKERAAVIWNDIMLAFKKIYKSPGKYDSLAEVSKARIQTANWLESRFLDDPETKNALFELFGGPVDKNRLFELVLEATVNNPNFER